MEEVITTTTASTAADQSKTQDMVEIMMSMMKEKEKRKKPDSDVELEDDPYDKLAASRATPLGGQNNARIGAGNRRLPRVQTSRKCARERSNTRMLVRSG